MRITSNYIKELNRKIVIPVILFALFAVAISNPSHINDEEPLAKKEFLYKEEPADFLFFL